MYNRSFLIFFSAFVVTMLVGLAIVTPLREADAFGVFSPFGGKVVSYNPAPQVCINTVTLPVALATAGTVWLTIEKIEVGPPKGGTLGLARVNGIIPPFITTIYRDGGYMQRGTWVTGTSLNICDVCGKAGDLPGVKQICGVIPGLDTILNTVCGVVGEGCPFNNLIHTMGTSAPSIGVPSLPSLRDLIPFL